MHSYDAIKRRHGRRVSQTVDTPILVFDYWELSDAFGALLVVFLFGVIFYEWGLMFVALLITLGAVPAIRRRNQRGVFLHWPYRHLRVSLPGLVNPKGRRRYSD